MGIPTNNRVVNFRSVATILFGIGLFLATAQAQTFSVLHYFSNGPDGAYPIGGMYQHGAGALYGTASGECLSCFGAVFKLAQKQGSWILTPIFIFKEAASGAFPQGELVAGPDGGLYSTTYLGNGGLDDCGVVFEVKPGTRAPASVLTEWSEDLLHIFGLHGSDGCNPNGGVIFDQAGNVYGAADGYGNDHQGVVYELSPSGSNWIYTILYTFTDNNAGDSLVGDLIFDSAGNLYGVSSQGGAYGFGEIYELSASGSGWTENVIHSFQNGADGANPEAGLIADNSGNFYGTTSTGGAHQDGTVFMLTAPNGVWTLNTIYAFKGGGSGPYGPLVMDGAGNLYGTTYGGGAYGNGSVFELTPSNGAWIYTDLHDFSSSGLDGKNPQGSIVVSANGTIFGTATNGGQYGYGTAWQITPN